jgi:hypothetical protein
LKTDVHLPKVKNQRTKLGKKNIFFGILPLKKKRGSVVRIRRSGFISKHYGSGTLVLPTRRAFSLLGTHGMNKNMGQRSLATFSFKEGLPIIRCLQQAASPGTSRLG